jgi:Secretion system C-terminal sorting domain
MQSIYIFISKIKKMKKFLTLIGFGLTAFTAQAQWMPNGSVMNNNIVFADINNVNHDIFAYASAGKHVFLDLFKMNCGSCESFHTGKAFDNYYNLYAKAGTVNDALVIQYQVTSNLSLADLKGQNSASNGSSFDWITGTPFPTANVQNTPFSFFKSFMPASSSSLSYGTPTLFLICNDKKFYKFTTSVNAADMRALATTKCGLAPLGVNEVHTLSFSYNLLPNPANDVLNIEIRSAFHKDVKITITNTMGQIVHSEIASTSNTDHFSKINTSNFNTGVYFVTMQDGNEKVTSRVLIQH